MDIRKWPMDQIMQLPDCCFGRRWPVGVAGNPGPGATQYRMSNLALPERCVIWEVMAWGYTATTSLLVAAIRLGDQLPTTAVQFDALETFLPEVGLWQINAWGLVLMPPAWFHVPNLKLPVAAAGRRLVGEFINAAATSCDYMFVATISSIPSEVPDCLLSV